MLMLCFGVVAQYAKADQQLDVTWADKEHAHVNILVTKHDQDMEECAQSGAEVFYRFEVQVCTRRKSWFDKCGQSTVITRALRFIPISDSYAVQSDILGDSLPAEKHNYSSKQEALLDLSSVNGIPAQVRSDETRKQFVNVRMKFTCKGQSSVLLDRLSAIITLGIVPTGVADTGWQEYFMGQ